MRISFLFPLDSLLLFLVMLLSWRMGSGEKLRSFAVEIEARSMRVRKFADRSCSMAG